MTISRENGLLRLPKHEKKRLGVVDGQWLLLTTKKGGKLRVSVADLHLEDLVSDGSTAYVSRGIYNDICGIVLNKGPMTLGCDPEFVLVDSKRNVVPANSWLPYEGALGSDGPLAELRPAPALNEQEVVENMRRLIRGLPGKVKGVFGDPRLLQPEGHSCWQNYAIGFHIHLGAPKEIVTYSAPGTQDFLRSFVTAMDYFVGIPAMLLENTNTRRLGTGMYGKPGDFRLSSQTIEYRTPGGFHLRHPQYAAGILALALCAGREIMEDIEKKSDGWRSLHAVSGFEHIRGMFNLPKKSSIRWALQEASKQVAVSYIPNLVEQIKKLKYFDKHEESIRRFFTLLGKGDIHSPNLLRNW